SWLGIGVSVEPIDAQEGDHAPGAYRPPREPGDYIVQPSKQANVGRGEEAERGAEAIVVASP
ncbi:MAG: hypothetical protein LC667_20620, partial [Thioalkalivibrio sp.]|nr:hypothetical protein [Thioalkalivibrio sp.]